MSPPPTAQGGQHPQDQLPPPPVRPPLNRDRRITMVGGGPGGQNNGAGVPMSTFETMESLYEPGDVIGNGTFGIIRKVRRKPDGMWLARKELNYSRMDERDLQQLSSEVNILQNLGLNEHIVRYHDRFVDKSNSMLYILMELCEGGDLGGLIGRCRREKTLLPEELVWSYLTQITLALSDCHATIDQNGRSKEMVLHRDIKPENVFLDRENNVKLGDFGLSKATSASLTNTYVGTPYYMSPELINGSEYGKPADIWSLGCLIYELCAWHPPFHEARTQAELAKLIREGKVPDLPKGYSPTLGSVVRSMLRQNPKQRPTTEQIKTLDQVKVQMRISELRKLAANLKLQSSQLSQKETDLTNREKSLLQKESDLSEREKRLSEAEADLVARRRTQPGGGARSVSPVRIPGSGKWLCSRCGGGNGVSNGNGSTGSTNHFASEDDGTAVIVAGGASSSSSSQGGGSGREESEDAVLARVASRPSLVPRRPLEERRNTVNFPNTNKRLSSCSLMSLDETPVKPSLYSQHNLLPRPSVTTSKSNPNIAAAAAGGYNDDVTKENTAANSGRPHHRRSMTTQPKTTTTTMMANNIPSSSASKENNPFAPISESTTIVMPPPPPPSTTTTSRPGSPLKYGPSRSRSCNRSQSRNPSPNPIEQLQRSPSKRSVSTAQGLVVAPMGPPPPPATTVLADAANRPAFRPSAPGTGQPNSINPNPPPVWDFENDNDVPSPFLKRQKSVTQIQQTGNNKVAEALAAAGAAGNLENDEDLPSPFIKPTLKKKISSGPVLSGATGTLGSNNKPATLGRAPGVRAIAPTVPTRAGRPSATGTGGGSRFSMGSRLLAAKAAGKVHVDEEGRRIGGGNEGGTVPKTRRGSVTNVGL